jgi:hypothetical protein
MTTFSDLIEHAVAYLGGDAGAPNADKARRAVVLAYRNLAANYTWSYYRGLDRIVTYATFLDGTVAYQQAGGLVPRIVTLTGGVWPAWAAGANFAVGDVIYVVQSLLSATTIQLTAVANPGADLAAGTAYQLWQDSYPLPQGVFKIGEMQTGQVSSMVYVSPAELVTQRRYSQSLGLPRFYTIVGIGAAVNVKIWPPGDRSYPIDFLSQRMPRDLRVSRKEQGSATVTAGQATVVGAGTLFTPDMVGCAFRYAVGSSDPVTGPEGRNPYTEEATVLSVESAQGLTLNAPLANTSANCSYVLSDPADIDDAVVGRLILREVERQCRTVSRMKPLDNEDSMYSSALSDARASDSRSLQPRVAGGRTNNVAVNRLRANPGSEFRGP